MDLKCSSLSASKTRAALVDRIYRLAPSFNGGDNPIWVFGPAEGFWLLVLCDEPVDGGSTSTTER